MQSPNLEQDPVTGDNCFDASKPCELGDIPPFAVAARTPEDVAQALAFAAQHSMQISVKASGHEYQGRSTAASALLIWLHNMRGVSTTSSFTACPGDTPQPALTAAPGDSWGDAYAAADAAGATVVGGSEISVSACGGYTLGGGHSWTSPAYGLAVDNLLQMTAVLANGSVVTASRCKNPDLFWALRGGGGGSFAVATSAVYALHPIPPVGVTGAELSVSLLRGEPSFAMLMDAVMYCAAHIWNVGQNGVVGGGYFSMELPAGSPGNAGFRVVFNGSQPSAQASVQPLLDFINANTADFTILGASLTPFASMHAWHSSWDAGSESTGAVSTIGSRLIPIELMADDSQRSLLAVNISTIAAYIGGIEGLLVVGGRVSELDLDSSSTSITPAWRAAGLHIVLGAGWELNATLATQQGVLTGVSQLTDILRAAVPNSGAYWSESDFLAPEWQSELFGKNYQRLQQVKDAVDPTGVFNCHHCVENSS